MKKLSLLVLIGMSLIGTQDSFASSGLSHKLADFQRIRFKSPGCSIEQAVNGSLIPMLEENENDEGKSLLKKHKLNMDNYSSFVVSPYSCQFIEQDKKTGDCTFDCEVTLIKGFFD